MAGGRRGAGRRPRPAGGEPRSGGPRPSEARDRPPSAAPETPQPAAAGVDPPAAVPRVRRADLHRLSEGANGLNLWGYVTADPLRQVLTPGYFAPVAGWLAPFDRILVTAGAGGGGRPSHATLVVIATGAETGADSPAPLVQRLPA